MKQWCTWILSQDEPFINDLLSPIENEIVRPPDLGLIRPVLRFDTRGESLQLYADNLTQQLIDLGIDRRHTFDVFGTQQRLIAIDLWWQDKGRTFRLRRPDDKRRFGAYASRFLTLEKRDPTPNALIQQIHPLSDAPSDAGWLFVDPARLLIQAGGHVPASLFDAKGQLNSSETRPVLFLPPTLVQVHESSYFRHERASVRQTLLNRLEESWRGGKKHLPVPVLCEIVRLGDHPSLRDWYIEGADLELQGCDRDEAGNYNLREPLPSQILLSLPSPQTSVARYRQQFLAKAPLQKQSPLFCEAVRDAFASDLHPFDGRLDRNTQHSNVRGYARLIRNTPALSAEEHYHRNPQYAPDPIDYSSSTAGFVADLRALVAGMEQEVKIRLEQEVIEVASNPARTEFDQKQALRQFIQGFFRQPTTNPYHSPGYAYATSVVLEWAVRPEGSSWEALRNGIQSQFKDRHDYQLVLEADQGPLLLYARILRKDQNPPELSESITQIWRWYLPLRSRILDGGLNVLNDSRSILDVSFRLQ